jgi:hypothetical protein
MHRVFPLSERMKPVFVTVFVETEHRGGGRRV